MSDTFTENTPNPATGLSQTPEADWPTVSSSVAGIPAIQRLTPNSETHNRVLQYLLERLSMSEYAMSKFYARWQYNEQRLQAYIDLPNYEQLLKNQNDRGKPPQVVTITLPYMFATTSTIVTYLFHSFAGRKPIFQVGTYKGETAKAAQLMETKLQYDSDHTRLIKHLWQYLNDGSVYGLGILLTQFETERSRRTVWKEQSTLSGFMNRIIGGGNQRVKEEKITYQGNTVMAIDPFLFFPDPRVPMYEVNKKGEFVFWRSFEGVHTLRKMEAQGQLLWTKHIPAQTNHGRFANVGQESNRSLLSRGEPVPGATTAGHQGIHSNTKNFVQVDRCTIEIIPAELGLGDSDVPEKWLFTIGNKSQILQAEPFDADHGKHPVAVIEPHTMGYGFGQPGITDYVAPLQDVMSWYINSHIHNIKSALNNMFVYDPTMVEEQDIKSPHAGKYIRLKRAAYGRDIKTVIQQLQVHDVTGNHINDLNMFMRMGDALSSVTDNLRGLQDHGGRKTATEVRSSNEAAASRLAGEAKLISAQGITDLTEMMSLNTQQYLDTEFYIEVTGEKGRETPLVVRPDQMVGDFYYPVHDGTLPLDRVAMLDIWRELYMGILQDQQLRSQFDVVKIFEWIAELGGARNIEQFKINVMPDQQLQQQAQAGNVVPINTPGAGAAPGLQANPGDRLAGQ